MARDLMELQREANEARVVKEHPAFQRVHAKLTQDAMEDFRRSAPEEQGRREEAYWRLRTLEAFEQALVAAIKAPGQEGARQDRVAQR